jgi:hypothetical protein
LNLERYVQEGREALDPDRARGLAEKIIEELQNHFDWLKTTPEDQIVRSEIASAVTMAVIPTSVWVQLRELREREPFDPNLSLALSYRDGRGTEHHATTVVTMLQRSFIFFKPFAFFTPTPGSASVLARLSPEVSAMLDARLKSEHVEVLQFDLAPGFPSPSALFRDRQSR